VCGQSSVTMPAGACLKWAGIVAVIKP
jgi:hypothetical protein